MRNPSALPADETDTKLKRLTYGTTLFRSLGVMFLLATVIVIVATGIGLTSEATRAIAYSPRFAIGFPILGSLMIWAAVGLQTYRDALAEDIKITRAGAVLDEPNLNSH